VPGVPADFRLPRGWPTPTDKWVRENAFWQPPPGWTPVAGARAAPEDWSYWVPNTLWTRVAAPRSGSIAPFVRIANWLVIVYIAARVAGLFLGNPPALAAIALIPMIGAIVCFVTYGVLRRRLTRQLMVEFAVLAQRGRTERLTKEYQRYLTAMS
jgi:hypothetical protein